MSDALNEDQVWLSAIVSSFDDAGRILGYTAEEAIDQSIRLIIPPEQQQEGEDVLRKIRAGEGSITTRRFVGRRTGAPLISR